MEVINNGNRFHFFAINSSYYPYMLELKITQVSNLSPERVHDFYRVHNGRHKLISLTMKNRFDPVSYKSSFYYTIGIPCESVDPEYPYLVPIKKAFEFQHVYENVNLFRVNTFKLSSIDTVFCMRKGKVVAAPNMYHENDRISDNESLEILHNDGTIMVYEYLDPTNIFVEPGKQVFPGQAIGLINNNLTLEVKLYQNMGKGFLKGMNINYCIDESTTEPFTIKLKETTISHPVNVVTKEMTKREIKKYYEGKQSIRAKDHHKRNLQ